MKKRVRDVGELRGILMREHEMQCSYHDHKERMAWAAVAGYVAVTGVVVGLFHGAKLGYCPAQEIGIGAGFFLVLTGMVCFLHMQFTARWESADISDVLRRRIYDPDYARRGLRAPESEDEIYPIDIHEELVGFKKERTCSEFLRALAMVVLLPLSLPIFWGIELANRKRREKKRRRNFFDPRWRTEIPSYLIAALSFSAQLCSLFGWF